MTSEAGTVGTRRPRTQAAKRATQATQPPTTGPTTPPMSNETVRTEAVPSGPGRPGRTATVNLPFVTAQFRLPDVEVPRVSGREVMYAANAARSYLPAPPRLAYFAGLGLAAAFEVIEWPVAVAIGAGTVIARAGDRGGSVADRFRATPQTAATGL
jgi:hypothetical protein